LLEPLNIGIYILLFIPGFIFVQTKDYHLLREKKPQFEKTLEIILWSAVIWLVAIASPYIPFGMVARASLIKGVETFLTENNNNSWLIVVFSQGKSSATFFLSVCLSSFIIANIWGIVRKSNFIDGIIKYVTGRDWYPSIAFRFFKDNLDKVVEVTIGDLKYVGILFSAPDTKDDKYIILRQPHLIYKTDSGYEKEELKLIDSMVIKFDDINEIKAYNETILKSKSKKGDNND